MFRNEYPIFLKKHLLKIEMLENLRDFPRDLVNIFYQDYSDGIVSGCEVTVEGNQLIIHPGIIIHQGILYTMTEAKQIPYANEDCIVYLKVQFLYEHSDEEKNRYLSKIKLELKETNQKDEIELCRFRLQKGSRLRAEYVDFEDFNTSYDTVNRIYVHFAAKGGTTLWPHILQAFANEAMKYQMSDPLDIAFCMTVLGTHEAVNRQLLIAYLNARNKQQQEHFSNIDIYSGLREILEDIKYGRHVGNNKSNQNKQIMFV